jgi:hypothetical protein
MIKIIYADSSGEVTHTAVNRHCTDLNTTQSSDVIEKLQKDNRMTIPTDHDDGNDNTVQQVLPRQHHMLQQNMLAHAVFVRQFCLDRHISMEGLIPNVMLQLATAMIQTHFAVGGFEYHLITNTEGEHIFQRDGIFDVHVIEAMA